VKCLIISKRQRGCSNRNAVAYRSPGLPSSATLGKVRRNLRNRYAVVAKLADVIMNARKGRNPVGVAGISADTPRVPEDGNPERRYSGKSCVAIPRMTVA
jgi:hypothetical protein